MSLMQFVVEGHDPESILLDQTEIEEALVFIKTKGEDCKEVLGLIAQSVPSLHDGPSCGTASSGISKLIADKFGEGCSELYVLSWDDGIMTQRRNQLKRVGFGQRYDVLVYR